MRDTTKGKILDYQEATDRGDLGFSALEIEEQNPCAATILLILPCMNWRKYGSDFENSRFWRTVLRGIEPWRQFLDIYSVDCIRLKSTRKVLGLWSPYKNEEVLHEIITRRLDSYPAWTRYKVDESMKTELENAVRRELVRIASQYQKIVSFVNVKAYYECMLNLSREFGIVALPRKVDWRAARAVPCRNLDELKQALSAFLTETSRPVQCASSSGRTYTY